MENNTNNNINFDISEKEDLTNAEQLNQLAPNETVENYITESQNIDLHIDTTTSTLNYEDPSNNTWENRDLIDAQYSEEKKTSKKKGFNSRLLSYIATGLICSVLGGVISAGIMLYANPSLKNPVTVAIEKAESKNTNSSNRNSNNGPVPYLTSTNTSDLSVAQIAKKVGPAVVGVSVKIGSSSRFSRNTSEGMGSGIIINADGYILTNYHVISDAQQVSVILSTGKEVPAKVVNYDAESDVAIVRVTEKIQMPAVAELGDSDKLEVGELAVAIGNPLGRDFLGSVTSGIISAVNRALDGENGLKYIQTDAAINQGNSGGALVNSKGQVIGINTAKIGATGVEGLGFAIPINHVKPEMETLVKPILKIGIAGKNVTDNASKPIGFCIEEVQEFSPAEKAGLQPGDVIVKFDGEKVTTVNDINKAKGNHKAGDTVKIEVLRDNKSKILEIKLSE